MADDIVVDKEVFYSRLSNFIKAWKDDKRTDELFQGVGSIVLCVGKASEGTYTKATAFQLWLLGYEFPSTLTIITHDGIHFVTTKKKASYLEPIKGGKVPMEILVRGKDAEQNAEQFRSCLDIIKKAGNKVGVLSKDPAAGPFVDEWKAVFGEVEKDVEQVDMSLALSAAALVVKDEKELRAIRDASRASSALMDFFVNEMSEVLDAEKKVTHRTLADKIDNKIDDAKFFQKVKVSANFDFGQLDWAYHPVVQSSGNYDLRFTAESDEKNLQPGVILSALGLRYQSYASLVARTYMVNPSKIQESNYKLLQSIHDSILKSLRPGAVPKDIYNDALALLKSKKPELEKSFVKSVGWGIGIEAKDPNFMFNAKNTRPLRDGMTVCILTGLSDIEGGQEKSNKTYALAIADTVRITAGDAAVFTKDTPADPDSVSFFFDDEDEPQPKQKPRKDPRSSAIAQTNIKSTRLRAERTANHDAEKEAARREHQKELHARRQQQGLEKYAKGAGNLNGTEEKKFKRFESYKRESQFPNHVKDLMIVVDTRSQSVVLPIMGRPVPFHINTIKTASTTAEGEYTSLRINFLSPGQGVGRKDDQPFQDPTAHFVRSLTFRSKDTDRMEHVAEQISEMKKEANRRENEKKEMEDVVEQDKLIIDRRPVKLENIFVRPSFDNKRVPGRVEIHQNGIRYVHAIGDAHHIDILFNNVRHLFFQPSKHELIVIIHVHLINPIMIGKRKTRDIQFYREATDMQFDETGNRKRKHRMGDEDEFEAEQEERRRRAILDKEFLTFAKRIEDAGRDSNLRVDMPFRDLGFNGVPSRSSVWIQPTTDCLVQLSEPPFMVVTLDDIEIVHLERVQFGLKNFDMVIVFKDFNRSVQHVNTIPMESIDAVKDWLDSVEIPFTEGPLNLQWATIMKTVQADPHEFFSGGGWSFLDTGSDAEDEEEEEEEESAFEMSESEFGSDESSEEDSEFDENASAEASAEEVSEEDSGGEDWDELEKKAKKKDRESGLDDEDDRKGRKRKR